MIETEPAVENGAHPAMIGPNWEALEAQSAKACVLLRQVDLILHSEELRNSQVIRRLLKFLADKTLNGEADELKEYIVAIDGLGKPASYDPRHNSAVRIQVGRLRQKLADYYRAEGQHDPILIDVPKGHFKLNFEYRDTSASSNGIPLADHVPLASLSSRITLSETNTGVRFAATVVVGVLAAVAVGTVYNAVKPVRAKAAPVANAAIWNADMEDLWRPYIATERPTIVAIEDPLFVEFDGKKGIYYRDKTLNNWHDVTTSPTIEALHRTLKNREIAPSRYYTAFGEVDSSFLVAKALGSHIQNLSVVKTTDLSMRALTDNNVVFVGIQNIYFTDPIQSAPMDTPLQQVHEGIRNAHPGPNEPAIYLDSYSTAPMERGIAYALVTHVPGPLGGNDVESFTCSRAAGYVAAVKAFTNPAFVHVLVGKLKQASGGRMPRYYQVLLKVKFTADVPTEITYVLARQLRSPGRS